MHEGFNCYQSDIMIHNHNFEIIQLPQKSDRASCHFFCGNCIIFKCNLIIYFLIVLFLLHSLRCYISQGSFAKGIYLFIYLFIDMYKC